MKDKGKNTGNSSALRKIKPKAATIQRREDNKKNKVRLFSKLTVNVPILQQLMLILPSLPRTPENEGQTSNIEISPTKAITPVVTTSANALDTNTEALSSPEQSISPVKRVGNKEITNPISTVVHSSHHLVERSHPQIHHIPATAVASLVSTTSHYDTNTSIKNIPKVSTHLPIDPILFKSETIQGTYGNLKVDSSGGYTFTLNPNSPAYVLLQNHQTGTDSFTLHLSNGATLIVQVPITGKQDLPVISGDLLGTVTEDKLVSSQGFLTTNGKIDVLDPDQNQSGLQAETLIGKFGVLTIDLQGHWKYCVDNSQSVIQALTDPDHATESFTVHTIDGTPQILQMVIGGTDDNAVISGVDTGTATEDLTTRLQGQLSIADSDLGEDHFQASRVTGNFGSLVITKDGAWTYDLDNTNPAVQALGQGTTATDTITVQSADGTTHQVTITVNGTNDKAVIGGTNAGTVTEESQLQTSGTLTVTDVDTGEAHFSNTDIAGRLGTLHLTDSGGWTYALDNSNPTVQALAKGQQVKDIISVQSADGTPHQITIVVNGQNDAAVITGTTTGAVTEDRINGMQWLLTDGKMHVSDSDSGEAKFDPVIHAHNYAGIGYTSILGAEVIVTPDGDWHYQLDNNIQQVQSLGQGQSYVDKVTVHTVDGTTQELQITITGTNDNPTVTGSRVLPAGSEDQTLHISQAQLLAGTSDIDKNDAGTLHVDAVTADHGTVTHNADGSFTFHPDKDYNGQVHFTYDVKDAHGGSAQATASTMLAATSDSAIISEVSTDHVTEDGSHSRHNAGVTTELANGRLQVVDPDSGEDKFQYSQFGETAVHDPFGGMLRIDSMGNWGYSVNNANLQHLAQGQTETVVYRVHSYDGTAYELHIDVIGTNDVPTVTQVALSNGTEDIHYQMQASQFGFTDIDTSDTLHSIGITALPPATQGKFVLDGHDITAGQSIPTADISKLQFVPVPNFNGDVQFKYTVNDGHTDSAEATNTLHFDAVGDAAIITGTSTGDVDEGHGSYADMSPDYAQPGMAKLGQAGLTADGKLDIVDPDSGESVFAPKGGAWNNSYHGQYGHLLLNTDGTWHYHVTVGSVDWIGNRKTTIGTTIDELGENQTLTDTITVYSKDGTVHDIVITIHGDNDRPYISSEATLSTGTEDTALTFTKADLLANTVDVDANDAGKLTIANLLVDHGSVVDNKDGTYTFTPTKDYNGQVHFTYDVEDAHGGVTATGANLHLQATDDTAHFLGTDTGSLTEDKHVQGDAQHTIFTTGVLDVTDPDAGEDHFRVTRNAHALHDPYGGTLTIGKSGDWSYSVPNRNVQHLGQGQSEQVQYEVQSTGGDKHIITLTIHGTNDAPTVSAGVQLNNGREDTTQIITSVDLLANATDVDSNDLGQLSISNLTVNHGSILDNGDGTFTLVPEKDYNGQLHFQYQVHDHHGGVTSASASMSVVAVNDRPDVQPLLDSVKEDSTSHHLVDLLTGATDKEGDVLSISQISYSVDGSAATTSLPDGFILGPDGHSLVIDATYSAFQHLSVGQTQQVVVNYIVDDGHGGQAPQSATLTIEGADDKAALTSTIIQMTESQALASKTSVYHGNLQLTDPDTGDHTQFVFSGRYMGNGYAPGSLYIWPDGSYEFRLESATNRHADDLIDSLHKGESLEFPYQVRTSDGQRLNIIVKVTGEDDQARIVVGQYSSLDNHAYEDNLSPGSIPNQVWSGGNLHVVDPDHGQAGFVAQNFKTPEGGHFSINVRGGWQYTIDNAKLQHLGEGQSYQKTFTVESIDGTSHQDITVTVHGTNDVPIVTSSVTLSQGTEDTPIVLRASDLLAHASDVDDNSQLTVHNLSVDHGLVVDNHDGSFTFTPDPNYNGTVHFTYDVADRHGGIAHTGANTSLAAVNDAAVFGGVDTGNVTEDHNVHASIQGNYSYKLETSGTLTATDTDAGESGFDFKTLITASTHPEWAPYQSKLGGQLEIDQHGNWNYYIDNRKPEVQGLSTGETLTDTVTIHSKDGTPHVITITITGTNDTPTLGVNQTSSTTGTLTETDVDVKDTHTFSVVSSGGQFGSLSVDPNTGDYVYTPNTSITGMSYNPATNTYHGVDVFEVKVSDGHTEDSKFITFDASGHVTMSPTGGLTTSTTVPQQPTVTTTLPTLLMVNNVAPTNTVTLDLASTSDSGSSNTDNLTNDTTPTITGHTDIPYSQVTVYDGSTPVGHALSDASGQYSVAVSSLSDGDHNLSAKALAPSSVLPATSSLLSVHIATQVHVGIQTDPITADNVINAQESNSPIDITGSVSGDYNAGDIVTLDVNGTQHTGVVDAKGHYSIAVLGSELIGDADQKIEASIAVTDTAGNSAHATADVTYQVDTQVSVPTITFENAGADNLYSKAEIARGHANTITATVTPPSDAKVGEHLVVNGQNHVLDAHTLQHGIQIEVHPGSNVQATMTDEHGNTAGSQGFAASAIPEPIIVRPPSGSHQVSGTLGVPPLLPSLTPVPTAQSGWRIHLPNGQYVTSHHGQYGTLTIDPQTGHLHYQEQAQVHTGPHGSASGIGQHEDKFEVALQGTNQDEVVAHVNVQILSHGPGHSGKLIIGTEVVDMTITPVVHTSHPAPPSSPVQHDEPDIASQTDFTVTLIDDSNLDLTLFNQQEPDQKTSHHGAAAYLNALGIKPDATSTTVHDQPADMDIILAQVDQQEAATHDQTHLDMSDALEHHDANVNHNQDDEYHHHNDLDGLPDIDPNN